MSNALETDIETKKFYEEAKNKKINPNVGASDIIFCCRFLKFIYYHNISSHRYSFHLAKLIRGNKNFLIFNKVKYWCFSGRYLYADKDTDMLYFVHYILKRCLFGYKLVEVARNVFDKKGHFYRSSEREDKKENPYLFFDICGQIKVEHGIFSATKQDILYYMKKNRPAYLGNDFFDIGAEKTLYQYFGGILEQDGYLVNFSNSCNVEKQLLNTKGFFGYRVFPMYEFSEVDWIDDKTFYRIKSRTENAIKECTATDGMVYHVGGYGLSYVKKEQDKIFIHVMQVIFLQNGTLPDDVIPYLVKRKSIPFDFETGPVPDWEWSERFAIFGLDGDLKGSFMEYSAFFVTDWLNMLDSYAKEEWEAQNKGDSLCLCMPVYSSRVFYSADKDYFYKYGFYNTRSFFLIHIFAVNPLAEKLYNLYPDNLHFRRRFYSALSASNVYGSVKRMEKMFGEIYINEKTLNKALMLPKGMIEFIINNHEDFSEICYLKWMFHGEEAKEYFLRMNRVLAEELVVAAFNAKVHISSLANIVEILIRVHGPKNWKGYIQTVNDMVHWNVISDYSNYVSIINDFGIIGEKIDWRFNNIDSFHIAYEKLKSYYEDMHDEIIRQGLINFYENNKKYEYSNRAFCIRVPKTVDEFVEEGIKLRHCVKEFIQSVIQGQTIILFIRDAILPDEPYYTLEIRDNMVRQCHGFDNCNVFDGTPLSDFLKKFCENYGITFDYGERRVGPGV